MKRENGFTLIELLVSLVILGLVATMLLGGVRAAALMAQRSDQRATARDSVTTAQAITRNRLDRLAAIIRLDGLGTNVDARGDANGFTFVAPPADQNEPNALQRFRLTLSANRDLMLYSTSSLSTLARLDGPSLIGWRPIRLLRNVASLSIAYFGPDRITGQRAWQNFWSDRPQPPDAVRVRVGFAPGDPRRWPDLIVHPQATANSLCKIDAFSGRCGTGL